MASLYLLGCSLLTYTSTPAFLKGGLGLGGLVVGMILIGIGGGGFKAVMAPFIGGSEY